MIVALGKVIVEMTETEFNQLAILKNKRDLIESREKKTGVNEEENWDKANNLYCELYRKLVDSKKQIAKCDEQLFL